MVATITRRSRMELGELLLEGLKGATEEIQKDIDKFDKFVEPFMNDIELIYIL